MGQDLEPEYVAVAPDSRTAFVALQENNALAVVDLAAGAILRILALGAKDHALPNQGLDPSDRDGPSGGGAIRIRSAPVLGLFQPDAIAVLPLADGAFAVLAANEGDARDWPGFSEELRVGATAYRLDPQRFPNAAALRQNAELGRLVVTNRLGDSDGDGDFDAIYAFGARSISLFHGSGGALLWDSGDELERITALVSPPLFNSEGTPESFDTRSDNKGPEPEALSVAWIGGRRYAVVGLERTGGFLVYDLTDPLRPLLLGYGPST
ncbi:MAG: alkaline phosphatase, partial [Elioraea sp.]|nr:alkaline phosphatase [Elioraea sp.]